jgi:hypothetical protein
MSNYWVYNQYKGIFDSERLGWIDGIRFVINDIDASHDRGYNDDSPYAHGFDRAIEAFDGKINSLWLFGHYHKSFKMNIYGTEFICLAELEYLDIEL